MMSAHGQEMTRKLSAGVIHAAKSKPLKRGGTSATSTAMSTTTGVYQREKRVMNFSGFAFCAAEFSTSSKIFATALSETGRTTSARTALPALMQPESISPPARTSLR